MVADSRTTGYRILSDAGLLKRNNQRSRKGTGFQQPLVAHEHWHIDISYLNIAGTFYFMATILDGLWVASTVAPERTSLISTERDGFIGAS